MVETNNRGPLVIERLDQPGERYELPTGGGSRSGGKFYDLAKTGTALAPDGVYIARLDPQRIVFKVDARAKPGATPMIGRLVRFD